MTKLKIVCLPFYLYERCARLISPDTLRSCVVSESQSYPLRTSGPVQIVGSSWKGG